MNPIHPMQRRAALAAMLAGTAALAACGGGGSGDGDLPCGGSDLRVELTYEVNGQLVDARSTIVFPRGAPVVAAPRIVGLPGACQGRATLTVSQLSQTNSNSGVVVDSVTGIVTGTPIDRNSVSLRLSLRIEGYSNSIEQLVRFIM